MTANISVATKPKQPIPVHLCGPFKGKDANYHLRKWGVRSPWDTGSLDTAALHYNGGYATFQLPDTIETIKWIRKALKHQERFLATHLLGRLVLFSSVPLADAIWLQRWIIRHLGITAPGALSEWRDTAVLDVDVLQKRWPTIAPTPGGTRAVEGLARLRDLLDENALAIETERYEKLRASLTHQKETAA